MAEKSAYQFDNPGPAFPGLVHLEGNFDGKGLRLGFVVSRYNGELTGQLLEGAVSAAVNMGVERGHITVAWVPGAYELSSAAALLAASGKVDALVAIGVVIQGETDHARLINEQISQALASLSREHGIPVLDGVVPAGTLDQAVARCSGGAEGRGGYLAKAAVEMSRVFEKIRGL